MTTQTRKFIEIEDIIGIQIECKKCHASLLVSGDTMRSLTDQHNDALCRCPSCQNDWTALLGSTLSGYDDEVKKFMRTLEKMRNINERLGCEVRFELKDDAPLARASDSKA
jgi:transposase-like protein